MPPATPPTMTLRWVSPDGVRLADPAELRDGHERPGGYWWLDVPSWSEDVEDLLATVFGAHPLALAECRQRNHVPLLHVYPEHAFVAVHAPELGSGGHVHYLELDQFVSPHYLVTVHGPLNPVVPLDAALRETREVADRLASGRLRPRSPYALAYAIVSTVVRKQSALVADLARQVGLLEQRVTAEGDEEPQQFLSQLFAVRHQLLTIKTMASQGGQIYARAVRLATTLDKHDLRLLKDVHDQYERVASISQSQLDFLGGVTEFFRARTDTKMTIAAERLAVISSITLPVTAISSVVGMNVIVNDATHWVWLGILLSIMLIMSAVLLRWARRQGWW